MKPARVSPLLTDLTLFLQSVTDKRAGLYNKLVASYHRAKTERAEMARELEAAQGMFLLLPTCGYFYLFLAPAG